MVLPTRESGRTNREAICTRYAGQREKRKTIQNIHRITLKGINIFETLAAAKQVEGRAKGNHA
jgi:hypothetical protein